MRTGYSRIAVVTSLACTLALSLLVGCPPPAPTPITVNAGDDQTLIVGTTGTAAAVVTGATGTVTFTWAITAPGAIVGSSTGQGVSFTSTGPGAATLSVTASDAGTGTTATDTVLITFQASTAGPLTANAGTDQRVRIGDILELPGGANGGVPPYSFQWQQISGPGLTVDPATVNTSALHVTADAVGTSIFQLTVTDGTSSTATDTVTVLVLPPPVTREFTPGTDNLTGTEADDTFNAPVQVVGGIPLQTLNGGDNADGGGGTDTLNAVFNGTNLIPGPLNPILTGIEVLNITDAIGLPLDAISITGATTINSVASLPPVTVNNLGNLVNGGIFNSATSGLILGFAAPALAGPTDAMTLTLNNAGGAILVITTPATATSSVEIINIVATGLPSTLNALIEGGGIPTLATVNVSGEANLTINSPIPASTLNAGTFTANLLMNSPMVTATGATVSGGAGNDTLLGSPVNDAMSGGAGNDTLSGLTGVDTLTLGTGADVVQITAAGAAGVDRKIVTDFDVTPTTGDRVNIAAALVTLSGTDNFTTAASIQNHTAAGALTVLATTELVRVSSAPVANFTDANSLDGTNLLIAIGAASITVPVAGDQFLFAVADGGGNVGIYLGSSGADTSITASELRLVTVLQAPSASLSGLVFNNFSNL
jgi:hypothetical protein